MGNLGGISHGAGFGDCRTGAKVLAAVSQLGFSRSGEEEVVEPRSCHQWNKFSHSASLTN